MLKGDMRRPARARRLRDSFWREALRHRTIGSKSASARAAEWNIASGFCTLRLVTIGPKPCKGQSDFLRIT